MNVELDSLDLCIYIYIYITEIIFLHILFLCITYYFAKFKNLFSLYKKVILLIVITC